MKRPNLLLQIPVPWVFIVTYLIGMGLQYLFPITIRFSTVILLSQIFGGFLMIIGSLFGGWCLLIFLRERTTPLPGKKPSNLVIKGPYRFSRNPMYVSLIIAYIGITIFLTQVFQLLLLPFAVAYIHWIVIPFEEQQMIRIFKEEYKQYCARVPRWI